MKKKFLLFPFVLTSLIALSAPDTWTQKTSLPGPPRAGAVAFAMNGYGYAGTGLDSSGNLLNDFWKYDPINDSWSQSASFIGTGRKNAVAFVTGSFAYVGTGYDSIGLTKDFYRYDALNNSWQRIEDLDSAAAVYPRRDAAAFAFNNKAYVVAGYDGTTFYSRENWEYDPARDTVWKEKTPFPLVGRRWATAFAIDSFGFVGMGYNYSQEYFHDFWRYDTTANTWTQMADYAGNKRGFAAAFVINGYAFAGTGFDGALRGDFYKYDYVNNQWSQVAAFGGLPTSAAVAFAVNGNGYVFGGVDTLGYRNELWEYTPDNTVGIGNPGPMNSSEITVAPNPAMDRLIFTHLDFSIDSEFSLRLFDASGKLVTSSILTNGEKALNVKDLSPGMYYFSIAPGNRKTPPVTGKVILQ